MRGALACLVTGDRACARQAKSYLRLANYANWFDWAAIRILPGGCRREPVPHRFSPIFGAIPLVHRDRRA